MQNGVTTGADVYAPTISDLKVNSGGSSATVSWTTGEQARGVVYYSQSPLVTTEYPHSVSVSGTPVGTDLNLHTAQAVTLTNLSSNTTYYYMVYATDASGNVSVSFPATFQTQN